MKGMKWRQCSEAIKRKISSRLEVMNNHTGINQVLSQIITILIINRNLKIIKLAIMSHHRLKDMRAKIGAGRGFVAMDECYQHDNRFQILMAIPHRRP